MIIITIPAELVSLLRDGCYFDLHGQLEEISTVLEHRDFGDIRTRVDAGLERANGARALLNYVGWVEPVKPFSVGVDLHEHREALLRALLIRIEVERSLEEDRNAGIGDRAEAKVHAGQLADLVQRVEEGEV